MVIECIVWICLGILVYTYLGYGLLVHVLAKIQASPVKQPTDLPPITVIIPAYNEGSILAQKIENTLATQYPAHLLQVIVITDGSTDHSIDVVRSFPNVLALHEAERKGKSAAINRAVPFAKSDLIIITDANALTNPEAFVHMAREFENPQVGGVSGEKRVLITDEGSVGGEGIYWKYESWLKRNGARFYTVVGAAGELFAFRKSCYTVLPNDTILDDFVLSMRIVQQGFRIAYTPNAYAMEQPSKRISDEFTRKTRISAGVFQTLGRLPFLFQPWADWRLFFQFISHRFLRWMVAPIALPVLWIFSGLLMCTHPFFLALFAIQSLLYLFAFLGFLLRNSAQVPTLFYVPFYFCMMNAAIYVGLIQYLNRKHTVLWKKAQR